MLHDTVETMRELERMHQFNIELLETLAVSCEHITKSHIDIPNASTLTSLLSKAWTLLDEIKEDPKIFQINRRKVTDFRKFNGTDEEVPVPVPARAQVNILMKKTNYVAA